MKHFFSVILNLVISHFQVLQVIDEKVDILYNIAAEIAGGVISSRDFVSLRTWGEKDGIYLGAGMGVQHPDKPKQKQYVRSFLLLVFC